MRGKISSASTWCNIHQVALEKIYIQRNAIFKCNFLFFVVSSVGSVTHRIGNTSFSLSEECYLGEHCSSVCKLCRVLVDLITPNFVLDNKHCVAKITYWKENAALGSWQAWMKRHTCFNSIIKWISNHTWSDELCFLSALQVCQTVFIACTWIWNIWILISKNIYC